MNAVSGGTTFLKNQHRPRHEKVSCKEEHQRCKEYQR